MPPPYSAGTAGPPGSGYAYPAPAPVSMTGYAPAPPVLQQQSSNTVNLSESRLSLHWS